MRSMHRVKVGLVDRNGEQFANTQVEFDSKFDFNNNSEFQLKVWSPLAGTNVLVKLEDISRSRNQRGSGPGDHHGQCLGKAHLRLHSG